MPTVLITGGHGFLGFECAKQLAFRGFHLILAGRKSAKLSNAADSLRKEAKGTVSELELDLSSMASVREAAARCRSGLLDGSIDELQAILCNAGGRFNKVTYSPDGYEQTFAVNCLGHFLFVELLADSLAPNGRIVFTTSGTHNPDLTEGKMVGKAVDPDAMVLANTGKSGSKPISAGKRYTTAKLCTVLYAYEMARRLARNDSAITATAFDPGYVPNEGFLREMPALVRWLAATRFIKRVMKLLGATPGDLVFSGTSLARIAVDPEYAEVTGKYLQANDFRLLDARSSAASYDKELALKLWSESKQLVHLRPDEEAALLR